jgi:pectate lyase
VRRRVRKAGKAMVVPLLLGAVVAAAVGGVGVGAGGGVGSASAESPRVVDTAADAPVGWASAGGGTTGGAGAAEDAVHVVDSRAELATALTNGGAPEEPKVIYVRGAINGHETDDGELLDDQDYAPGWDLDRYMACFGPDGEEWSDDRYEWCKEQRTLRVEGSNAEKAQIQLEVPGNTTLVGVGEDARLLGVYLSIRTGANIIIRNLHFEAPVDYFPSWDPWDGDDGSWNARFDALSMVTGSRVWVDHCTFTDGRFPDSQAPVGFGGEPVQRHDGLLDIEDGTDYVTVSYSRFADHEKTALVSSGDGQGDMDRGHLRITFHHNHFDNSAQRSPRVRFGRVHSFNNYFTGSTEDPDYPLISEELGGDDYFLGMGLESRIASEYNAFEYAGPGASPDIVVANLNGHRFRDVGSWFGGRPVDVNAIAERKFQAASAEAIAEAEQAGTATPGWALKEFTTDVGWRPSAAYAYDAQRSAAAVRETVLAEAGAGKLPISPESSESPERAN